MTPEQHIEIYLGEWLDGIKAQSLPKEEMLERLHNSIPLHGWSGSWNYVSREGYHHLNLAADLLLKRSKEQRKITQATARNCLIQAHHAHLEKAKRTGIFSEYAIVSGAVSRLADVPRHDGLYVFPAVFALKAKNSRFRVGPVTIFSKDRFQSEYGEAISQYGHNDERDRRFFREWRGYTRRYDHFLAVEVKGHESEMAWGVARETAEYALNLVRMRFGYQHARNIKIGGGYFQEQFQSKIFISSTGEIGFSTKMGPWGSHLDDEWTTHLDDALGGVSRILSNVASWIASGEDPASPVLERLGYANALLSQAYSEPHDHVRLVRLIAALEALALLPKEDKSESLARRCAKIGGWENSDTAEEIHDAVVRAYRMRNAVVHGDAPSPTEVMEAFMVLEQHILSIYVGFLDFLGDIYNAHTPKHIKHLRRLAAKRIETWPNEDS